jgi:hypothetical protein
MKEIKQVVLLYKMGKNALGKELETTCFLGLLLLLEGKLP